MSKATVFRAYNELEYYGFIKLRKKGQFLGRLANEWEITFIQSEGYHPTHDWKEKKARLNSKKSKPEENSIMDSILDDYKAEMQNKSSVLK
tara:strand:+ start:100 stop:372 length:273 start_codon:yes stop_codon:yes gene_type:complete